MAVQYIIYYRCPDDGTKWTMKWSCMCNDRCPTCNHEIEPYKGKRVPVGRGKKTTRT